MQDTNSTPSGSRQVELHEAIAHAQHIYVDDLLVARVFYGKRHDPSKGYAVRDEAIITLVLVVDGQTDPSVHFEHNKVTIDALGRCVAIDTIGIRRAVEFRMSRPMTAEDLE